MGLGATLGSKVADLFGTLNPDSAAPVVEARLVRCGGEDVRDAVVQDVDMDLAANQLQRVMIKRSFGTASLRFSWHQTWEDEIAFIKMSSVKRALKAKGFPVDDRLDKRNRDWMRDRVREDCVVARLVIDKAEHSTSFE